MTFFLIDKDVKSKKIPQSENFIFKGSNIRYIKFHPKARKRSLRKEMKKYRNPLLSNEIKERLKLNISFETSDDFLLRAFKNSFINLIERVPYLAVGVLFDGDYEFLERVFENSRSLVIIGNGVDSDFSEYLFMKYGHSPIVTDSISMLEECDATFSNKGDLPAITLQKVRVGVDTKSISDKEGFFSFMPCGFNKLEAAVLFSKERNEQSCHPFFFENTIKDTLLYIKNNS